MSEHGIPLWLRWAQEIQSLSQTGLMYATKGYDAQRYRRFMEISAEIVQNHTNLDKDQLLDTFLVQTGYATPKIDVRGAVIRDGKILLVQERADKRWCMPGGWADVGELPSQSIVREMREESGFEVAPRKVIGIYDANRDGIPLEFYHAYKIVFLCEMLGGQARPSEETLAVAFFGFENLPPLSRFRTNDRHLAEIRAHLMEEIRPTAFD